MKRGSHGARTKVPTRWLVTLALALVVAGLVLAGCGGSDDSVASAGSGGTGTTTAPTTTGEIDRETALLNFSKCMREDGGIPDYPDPTTNENGELQIPRPGRSIDRERFRDGIQACRSHLEGVINTSPEAQTARRDAQLEFAQCLRREGLDVADPDPNQTGPGLFGQLDRDDPKVQAAIEKCAPAFTGAFGNPRGGS